jgi:hypothetical protein
MACGRKAQLNTALKEKKIANGENPHGKGSEATRVGTIYHKLCEVWHGQGVLEYAVPSNDIYEKEYYEAERLFKAYKKFCRNDPGYWGHVDSVELGLPRGEEDVAALAEAFQFEDPLTAHMDMVVRIDNEARSRLKTDHDLVLPGAGLYILDHKTSKSKKKAGAWDLDWQFLGYQLMYAACFDEEPLGMIAANMTRTKEPKLHLQFVPWEAAVQSHEAFMVFLHASKTLIDGGFARSTECDSMFGRCYFYETGECNRV